MAFASWYSIKKRLPDCRVELETKLTLPMFSWANRVGVKITRNSLALLKVRPTVVAVRDFHGDLTISPASSSIQTAFVDYSEGCGDFVPDRWIHRSDAPFRKASMRFGSYKNLTVNEMAVLEFFERCNLVYRSIGGQ